MALFGVYGYGSSPYINNTYVQPKDEEELVAASVNEQPQQADAKSQYFEEPKAPKSSNPNDFVFDFKRNNDFNLVGAKSSVEDVDVAKAMEEMKKDIVLDQYKFFVGPANLGTDQDGTVRLKSVQ